jgi:CRISPR-associated protein Cas1
MATRSTQFSAEIVEELPHALVVDAYGVMVGKHGERLSVRKKDELLQDVPLLDLEQVLILSGGVALSSDAIKECAVRGIPIHFLENTGEPYATMHSPNLIGTVQTRREQLLAYADARSVVLAKGFAGGKIRNQITLLRYMAKNRKERQPEIFDTVQAAILEINDLLRALLSLEGSCITEIRPQLFSCEGRAAERYWDAAGLLLNPDAAWLGRQGRGAQDLVNSLLNYGYGILSGHVQRAVALAGLDPFGGYIHVDRPGKASLVLDLMEEFRQMVVDRTVFAMLNLGMDLQLDEEGRLTLPCRRLLIEKLQERLETPEPYGTPAGSRRDRRKLRSIIVAQARHVAAYVRGQVATYEPYAGRW